MLDAPERTGARFSILLFLGFLITPLIGFGTAVQEEAIRQPAYLHQGRPRAAGTGEALFGLGLPDVHGRKPGASPDQQQGGQEQKPLCERAVGCVI